MKRNRVVYTLLAIGAIGAFFGHGMWAIDGKDTFVKLFSGSFDHVLGVTIATDTATNWVRGIGWFDIAVAAVMTVMLIGNIRAKGRLYEFAYSRVALVVYSWGVVWGFATAASRVTAVGEFMPEIWDVVERAPNFMLPAALVYLVYQHRLDHTHSETTAGAAAGVRETTIR
ncbi:MAG TPA: hypothetical protein VFR67_07055 [Pilimelia sp.]|nr:hypothetical protein [Pilimelia sp.]